MTGGAARHDHSGADFHLRLVLALHLLPLSVDQGSMIANHGWSRSKEWAIRHSVSYRSSRLPGSIRFGKSRRSTSFLLIKAISIIGDLLALLLKCSVFLDYRCFSPVFGVIPKFQPPIGIYPYNPFLYSPLNLSANAPPPPLLIDQCFPRQRADWSSSGGALLHCTTALDNMD